MKNCMAIFSMALLGSNVYAQENMFVGVDIGSSKISVSSSGFSGTTDSEGSFSLKIGREYNDYRIYGKYLNVSVTNASFNAFTAHYDKYFPLEGIKPYIGVGVGFVHSKDDEPLAGDGWDPSGLAYGASGGVIFSANNNLTFELAFEYMLTTASDEFCNSTFNGVCTNTETADIDKYTNIKLGLNYSF